MCANFQPPKPIQFIDDLGWVTPTFYFRPETFPGYLAPIKILNQQTQAAELRAAMFGLVPFWSKDEKMSRNTYNARAESVSSKPSFREPWKKSKYALVPMAGFYEPDYATGKAIRWRIERKDQRAFTVAAIWDYWKRPDGEGLHSFSMLTINADGHPIMGRFHKPGDEKRSLVIVPPDLRDAWINASPVEAQELLVEMPASEFISYEAPIANKILAKN